MIYNLHTKRKCYARNYGRKVHIIILCSSLLIIELYIIIMFRCIQFPMSQRDFGDCAPTSQICKPRGLSIFLCLRQRRHAKEKRLQNGTGVQRSVGKM